MSPHPVSESVVEVFFGLDEIVEGGLVQKDVAIGGLVVRHC